MSPSPSESNFGAEKGPTRSTARAAGVIGALLGIAALWWLATRAPVTPLPDAGGGSSLWLVLLTGASIGGLSCLAVQGGLLAALIAGREAGLRRGSAAPRDHLLPLVQFLLAKVAAYAVLGALLGAFGSRLPLGLQGWLMMAVGLYMLVVVLQLLDVHPIVRRLAWQPPRPLQRLIRHASRGTGAASAWVLGALTVFVPCGVTLAMELMAVASQSPLRGALILFVFTLGTVPAFVVIGLLASGLGRQAHPLVRPVAAAAIAVVGVVTLASGARLAGLSVPSIARTVPNAPAAVTVPAAHPAGPAVAAAAQEATLHVRTGVFEPARLQVLPDAPLRLELVTEGTKGCIRAFVIPSLGIERLLPETGREIVELPPAPPGARIPFMCSMGMYSGVIEVAGP